MNAQDAIPSNAHVFETRSVMSTDLDAMTAFHESPSALRKLVPPPMVMQIRRDDRTSLTEGDLEFTLWLGPIPIKWHAQHEPGPTPNSFADRMVDGPMAYWRHEHIFEEHADGVALIDRITLAHKPGIAGVVTRFMFDGIPLRLFFFYRHMRTRMAVKR